MGNLFYGMLVQFSQGSDVSRSHLRRRYTDEMIDEAIRLGYIVEVRRHEDGDPVYRITNKGRSARDD